MSLIFPILSDRILFNFLHFPFENHLPVYPPTYLLSDLRELNPGMCNDCTMLDFVIALE